MPDQWNQLATLKTRTVMPYNISSRGVDGGWIDVADGVNLLGVEADAVAAADMAPSTRRRWRKGGTSSACIRDLPTRAVQVLSRVAALTAQRLLLLCRRWPR
eukprot:2806939-Prymnesium_polylepis.1